MYAAIQFSSLTGLSSQLANLMSSSFGGGCGPFASSSAASVAVSPAAWEDWAAGTVGCAEAGLGCSVDGGRFLSASAGEGQARYQDYGGYDVGKRHGFPSSLCVSPGGGEVV